MRKIDTSFITTGVGMPIKSGTLDHLQLSYQEALSALAQNIVGNYTTNKVYILTGCVNTGVLPVYNISSGYVFYNGEVFFVPAASFTAANTAVFDSIQTTYFTGVTSDPVEFTDGNTHSVHQIRQIIIADNTSGSGLTDYADAPIYEWTYEPITSAIFTSGTGTFTSGRHIYKRSGNTMILNFNLAFTQSTLGTLNSIGIQIDLPVSKAPDLTLNDVICSAATFNISSLSTTQFNVGNAFISAALGGLNKLEIYTPNAITGSVNIFGQIIYPI